jgi:hypothetical protein
MNELLAGWIIGLERRNSSSTSSLEYDSLHPYYQLLQQGPSWGETTVLSSTKPHLIRIHILTSSQIFISYGDGAVLLLQ